MTVKELINKLKQYPDNTSVYVACGNHYTKENVTLEEGIFEEKEPGFWEVQENYDQTQPDGVYLN